MKASLPFALPLLLALPLLAYVLYPPEVKRSAEVSTWAGSELRKMGADFAREIILAVLVIGAIVLWVIGGSFIDPTLTALVAIALMLVCGVVSWDDMAKNHSAWTTLVLLATLVTLADGLSRCRVRQVVRRIRRGACRRLFADADPGAAGRGVFLLALHVREPHRTHHGDDADDAGGGDGHPGAVGPDARDGAGADHRHHGRDHAYATGPGLAYYNSGYIRRLILALGTIFG